MWSLQRIPNCLPCFWAIYGFPSQIVGILRFNRRHKSIKTAVYGKCWFCFCETWLNYVWGEGLINRAATYSLEWTGWGGGLIGWVERLYCTITEPRMYFKQLISISSYYRMRLWAYFASILNKISRHFISNALFDENLLELNQYLLMG